MEVVRQRGLEAGRRAKRGMESTSLSDHNAFTSKLKTTTARGLTLLLVIQTGDHAVPKECDSNLTTPAESTLTGVPSSENLHSKTENQEIKKSKSIQYFG